MGFFFDLPIVKSDYNSILLVVDQFSKLVKHPTYKKHLNFESGALVPQVCVLQF
jgi:hypothetical protein